MITSTSRRQRSHGMFAFSAIRLTTVTISSSVSDVVHVQSQPSTRPFTVTVVPPRQPPAKITRYAQPVPKAKPSEIIVPRRGRDSKRRARDAESFRKYLILRRQLKPWSDAFRARHGRTPSLVDAHDSQIPGLGDRFVEYLDALDELRLENLNLSPSRSS